MNKHAAETGAESRANSQIHPKTAIHQATSMLACSCSYSAEYLCHMNWNDLTEESQLAGIKELSRSKPVVIFKHSTRCSISTMAKSRLERSIAPDGLVFYYLDLIRYRTISSMIADEFSVHHESPQVLIIRDGACVYDESHNGISMDEIIEQAA